MLRFSLYQVPPICPSLKNLSTSHGDFCRNGYSRFRFAIDKRVKQIPSNPSPPPKEESYKNSFQKFALLGLKLFCLNTLINCFSTFELHSNNPKLVKRTIEKSRSFVYTFCTYILLSRKVHEDSSNATKTISTTAKLLLRFTGPMKSAEQLQLARLCSRDPPPQTLLSRPDYQSSINIYKGAHSTAERSDARFLSFLLENNGYPVLEDHYFQGASLKELRPDIFKDQTVPPEELETFFWSRFILGFEIEEEALPLNNFLTRPEIALPHSLHIRLDRYSLKDFEQVQKAIAKSSTELTPESPFLVKPAIISPHWVQQQGDQLELADFLPQASKWKKDTDTVNLYHFCSHNEIYFLALRSKHFDMRWYVENIPLLPAILTKYYGLDLERPSFIYQVGHFMENEHKDPERSKHHHVTYKKGLCQVFTTLCVDALINDFLKFFDLAKKI